MEVEKFRLEHGIVVPVAGGLGFQVSQMDGDAEVEVPCAQPDPEPTQASQREPLNHLGGTEPFSAPSPRAAPPLAFFCPWCILPLHTGPRAEGKCPCGVAYIVKTGEQGGYNLCFQVP